MANNSSAASHRKGWYTPVDEDWLALHTEAALEPELPIIDPHQHLWEGEDDVYMLPNLLADTGAGHNITATVYIDCQSMYRADGPEHMKPVGEVEFANDVAMQCARSSPCDFFSFYVSSSDPLCVVKE